MYTFWGPGLSIKSTIEFPELLPAEFNQARIAAFGEAYTEVMCNFETAKINLQKETPLYRIIDETDLQLLKVSVSILKYSLLGSIVVFFLMVPVLAGMNLYKPSIKI